MMSMLSELRQQRRGRHEVMVNMIHQPFKIIGNIGAAYHELDFDGIYRAIVMAADNLHSFRWDDSYQRYAFAEQLFEPHIPVSN